MLANSINFFKGTDPNNYIVFAGRMWRIISVEANGTLKILKTDSVGTGYGSQSGAYSMANDYYNYWISDIDKSKIVKGNFGYGKIKTSHYDDLENIIGDENSKIYSGYISTISVSEYLRTNSDITRCSTVSLDDANYGSCNNTNWLSSLIMYSTESYMWTITPTNDNAYGFNGSGLITYTTNSEIGVYPAVYLSDKIELTGSGTPTDPYVVR